MTINKQGKTIAEAHENLAAMYRDLAVSFCESQDIFAIRELVNESIANETKARKARNRYESHNKPVY